jgi:hypothetical protein
MASIAGVVQSFRIGHPYYFQQSAAWALTYIKRVEASRPGSQLSRRFERASYRKLPIFRLRRVDLAQKVSRTRSLGKWLDDAETSTAASARKECAEVMQSNLYFRLIDTRRSIILCQRPWIRGA